VNSKITNRLRWNNDIIAISQTDGRELSLATVGGKPYDLSLSRIKLKMISTHPTSNLIDAGGNTIFQLVNIVLVARAIDLGVVSIKMGSQSMLDDYIL
jgi:hypothetical protein